MHFCKQLDQVYIKITTNFTTKYLISLISNENNSDITLFFKDKIFLQFSLEKSFPTHYVYIYVHYLNKSHNLFKKSCN